MIAGGGAAELFYPFGARARSIATNHLATQATAEVLHRMLNVEFDGPHIDAETSSDIPVRDLLDMRSDKYLAATLRQFADGFLEFRDFQPRLGRHRRIGSFVHHIHDGRDIAGGQHMPISFVPILGDVQRDPKQIVQRTANIDRVRHSVHLKKGLVQRLMRGIGRAQASRQALGQPLIVCRQCVAQRFTIGVGHLTTLPALAVLTKRLHLAYCRTYLSEMTKS